MKTILRSVSAMLAVLLLTACCMACNSEGDSSATSPHSTTATTTPTTSTTTAGTSTTTAGTSTTTAGTTTSLPPLTDKPPLTAPETAPPHTDAPAPETKPLPPEPITYPRWEDREDVELLATLDSASKIVTSISEYQEKILLSYALSDEAGMMFIDAYAQVLDLVTGTFSESVKLSTPQQTAVFLGNGNICVYDQLFGTVQVYNSEGAIQFDYTENDSSVSFYLDFTGSGTLWTCSWNSPIITKIPLSGETPQTFSIPSNEGGGILGHRGEILYCSAWDGAQQKFYQIDEDGKVLPLSTADGFFWGGNCFYTDNAPHRILNPANPNEFYMLDAEDAFRWIAAAKGSQLLVEMAGDGGDSESIYRVLDYENGLYYPALPSDPYRFYENFFFSQDGTLYFLTGTFDENGTFSPMELCRHSFAHDPQPVEIRKDTFNTLELEIASIANRINEKWGVKVFYQPHLLHLVASDYSAEAVTNLQVLYNHILQVETALSAYPEGFFDDLCYGDFTHLEIYLCGKFTPLNSDGITTAEAIANTRGSAMVIGVNVHYLDGQYPRVLAHELLHIMERRIDQIDIDILGEWVTLTPGGHNAYYYSYHDENGNEMNNITHTYYYEEDPAEAYFVDAYSKSFPTEDRARIFEKLMEWGGNPYFSDSPVMMAKARMLCKIIRENFPSVAATERASWEVR